MLQAVSWQLLRMQVPLQLHLPSRHSRTFCGIGPLRWAFQPDGISSGRGRFAISALLPQSMRLPSQGRGLLRVPTNSHDRGLPPFAGAVTIAGIPLASFMQPDVRGRHRPIVALHRAKDRLGTSARRLIP
jgi:hypothetical protein